MGWFDEQIKQKIMYDDELFESAFACMADVVSGESDFARATDASKNYSAIERILHYYHAPMNDLPEDVTDIDEMLEYWLRPTGIMRRVVSLNKNWYKQAIGPMLVVDENNQLIALIPRMTMGYTYTDTETGKQVRVGAKQARSLGTKALCFYRALPQKKLTVVDLARFIFSTLGKEDVFLVAFSTLIVSLIGLLGPYVNKLIFGVVIPAGTVTLLLPIAFLLLSVSISSTLINIFSGIISDRIASKTTLGVQASSMMRLLSLPASFFRANSSGELSARLSAISAACQALADALLKSGFTSLFSLIYIVQIFAYAPSLVIPALIILAISAIFSIASIFAQMKNTKRQMEASSKESGLVFSLISGVQKIKLTGSEKRAFANWAHVYAKAARFSFRPPWFLRVNAAISVAIGLFGTLVIYAVAGFTGVSVSDYMAFTVSYGLVMGAFTAISATFATIATIRPSLDLAQPLLETLPETAEDKTIVTGLMGGIELNNVSFRYNEDMPPVINNLSCKIRSGEYVAVVGTTGCGKSTLIRLLLGFEQPERGGIFFDGVDTGTVDLKSLRRKIGTVMQDGKLFNGDVFSNIIISSPEATLDDAWRAAEIADIAEDIRAMPMGMHTLISEGGGGVSGGQRQRLLIARAVVSKPRVLIFDEATSALDNITQRKVSEALDALKCTRIVVAHRLSTICNCDRIIVLDKGSIVEEGTFSALMEKRGLFYELAKRQIAE